MSKYRPSALAWHRAKIGIYYMLGAGTWRSYFDFNKGLRTIGAASWEYIKCFAHGRLTGAEKFILQLAQRIAQARFALYQIGEATMGKYQK